MMLRIGRIAYANCTPIFHGLQQHSPITEYQFIGGVPSHLNAMLSAGKIDVCPSSSIEYAHHSGRYLILPDLSISSIGAVASVLLFSRIPIEELDGQTILLSSESATSVNLLRILVKKRFVCSCQFRVSTQALDKALQEAPAMLLIGDSALRASMQEHDLLVYDLGELWHDWTGLPFVFALWLCARQVAEERYAEVACLTRNLITAKEQACTEFESIAQESPEAKWMGKERLIAYWTDNLSFDLGRKHLEGLALFYRYCAELGLLQNEPELCFLPDIVNRRI
ncbi:MAG: menaquinone biosynthesis protein [Desulfuromonadales bacterium]|nr:menaquinone biosynthesis protein [Desulfuromonadales bacterium]